jgi:hypothetical protein
MDMTINHETGEVSPCLRKYSDNLTLGGMNAVQDLIRTTLTTVKAKP